MRQTQNAEDISDVPYQKTTTDQNSTYLEIFRLQKKKNTLRRLAVAEITIGTFCVVLGIICVTYMAIFNYHFDNYPYLYYNTTTHEYVSSEITYPAYPITFGEGIWCGIWVIIAGILGLKANKINSSPCLSYTHMSFCVFGAMISIVLLLMASIWGALSIRLTSFFCLMMSSALLGLVSTILLIAHFCLSYQIKPPCCAFFLNLRRMCLEHNEFSEYLASRGNDQAMLTSQAVKCQPRCCCHCHKISVGYSDLKDANKDPEDKLPVPHHGHVVV